MTFFESLLALLLAAIVLLQISRRLALPYPAMLATAGVVVALIPGSPTIVIDPTTALALFIAPVVLDSAFDFPIGAAQRMWRPLVMLAVVAVLVSVALVAWAGHAIAGLPLAAGIVLGAIVAPPDAAAVTAVLGTVSLPRQTTALLKGESLFNDATALLLFSEALTIQQHGGLDAGVGLRIALGVPGGVLFGIGCGFAMLRLNPYFAGTLGGNILQFVTAWTVWIVAEHLELSAVLAVVAMAMTIARASETRGRPRMRVQSYAVWGVVVFLLNVLAFLLMGMQSRVIVGRMPHDRLIESLQFGAAIVAAVVIARFVVVLTVNRLAARFAWVRGDLPPATIAQGVFVGWSGMRGLLTMATAFALPANFPQRDMVVLAAFAVVLATLVVQGLTLTPLIRLLKLDRYDSPEQDMTTARHDLAATGYGAIRDATGPEAEALRYGYRIEKGATRGDEAALERYRDLGRRAIAAERDRLEELRAEERVDAAMYVELQEALDWRELALLPAEDRRIEES